MAPAGPSRARPSPLLVVSSGHLGHGLDVGLDLAHRAEAEGVDQHFEHGRRQEGRQARSDADVLDVEVEQRQQHEKALKSIRADLRVIRKVVKVGK